MYEPPTLLLTNIPTTPFMNKQKTKKDTQCYWTLVNTTHDIAETCSNRHESAECVVRRHIRTDSVVTGKATAHLTTSAKLDIEVQVHRTMRDGSFKLLWSAAEVDLQDHKKLSLLMLNTRKKVKAYCATFEVITVTTQVRTLTRTVKECDVPRYLISDYKRSLKSK